MAVEELLAPFGDHKAERVLDEVLALVGRDCLQTRCGRWVNHDWDGP